MYDVIKNHNPIRHAKSFKYAFGGLWHALLNEANFRVQVAVFIVAVICGFYFHINTVEWALILISMGLLLSAEMFNTVVENFVDFIIKEYDDGARIVKDLAAGFVLVTALVAGSVLILVFSPYFSRVF